MQGVELTSSSCVVVVHGGFGACAYITAEQPGYAAGMCQFFPCGRRLFDMCPAIGAMLSVCVLACSLS